MHLLLLSIYSVFFGGKGKWAKSGHCVINFRYCFSSSGRLDDSVRIQLEQCQNGVRVTLQCVTRVYVCVDVCVCVCVRVHVYLSRDNCSLTYTNSLNSLGLGRHITRTCVYVCVCVYERVFVTLTTVV